MVDAVANLVGVTVDAEVVVVVLRIIRETRVLEPQLVQAGDRVPLEVTFPLALLLPPRRTRYLAAQYLDRAFVDGGFR